MKQLLDEMKARAETAINEQYAEDVNGERLAKDNLRLIAALELAISQRPNYLTDEDWNWSGQMEADDKAISAILSGEVSE